MILLPCFWLGSSFFWMIGAAGELTIIKWSVMLEDACLNLHLLCPRTEIQVGTLRPTPDEILEESLCHCFGSIIHSQRVMMSFWKIAGQDFDWRRRIHQLHLGNCTDQPPRLFQLLVDWASSAFKDSWGYALTFIRQFWNVMFPSEIWSCWNVIFFF